SQCRRFIVRVLTLSLHSQSITCIRGSRDRRRQHFDQPGTGDHQSVTQFAGPGAKHAVKAISVCFEQQLRASVWR
ncbi:MAG TPA: hypothetical protein VFQ82_09600, partial [Stellaceae bacterium]|nr:hypothetical protein [Stellaceae bacterium]